MNVHVHLPTGDSPSGKALVSGTSIRGFESLIPSHRKRPSKDGPFLWLSVATQEPPFCKAKPHLGIFSPNPSSPLDIIDIVNVCITLGLI